MLDGVCCPTGDHSLRNLDVGATHGLHSGGVCVSNRLQSSCSRLFDSNISSSLPVKRIFGTLEFGLVFFLPIGFMLGLKNPPVSFKVLLGLVRKSGAHLQRKFIMTVENLGPAAAAWPLVLTHRP